MSDVTNRTIWMAGAWNHKCRAMRELPVSRTASWRGVVARAAQLLVDGNRLVLIVAAAAPLRPEPSSHDMMNARITTLVFSKQEHCQKYKSIRTYLEDDKSCRYEVHCDLAAIERQIRDRLEPGQSTRQMELPIISPILSYLLSGRSRKKTI
ncbi:MAG: hypothetical protein OES26_22080 [Gammaproteobacteria bacterium]|nr:hypothetical protein [Gammaproteobacteria bacterium]